MAYQNVGNPRFFVSHPLWALSLGVDEFVDGGNWSTNAQKQFINLDPSTVKTAGGGGAKFFDFPDDYYGFNFWMFLGHKFGWASDEQALHICTYGASNPFDGNYDISVNTSVNSSNGAI